MEHAECKKEKRKNKRIEEKKNAEKKDEWWRKKFRERESRKMLRKRTKGLKVEKKK